MRYLLPAILLLGTQIASAQSILKDKDDKELSVLLNEVVITGTGTEHYLKDAPVQTEVITSKALEQYQARSIDDLLSGLSPSLTFHDGDMGSHIQHLLWKINGSWPITKASITYIISLLPMREYVPLDLRQNILMRC